MNDYFIADDLSGALDAAGAFHRAGRAVTISLSTETWPDIDAETVVGFTTETRNLAGEIAARVVKTLVLRGQARGARLVYKKIDSTLRGPVAAELAALAEALPETRFLFAPANPAVGRTVRDGVLLVRGVPVAETEFARDPVSPVRESSIRRLLGNIPPTHVIIADAETDADLATAVEQIRTQGGAWVGVGSGALARPIAGLGGGNVPVATRTDRASGAREGPMLFVCGSAHPSNREQARTLHEEAGVPCQEVTMAGIEKAVAQARANCRRLGKAALMIEEARGDGAAALSAITRAAVDVIASEDVARVFVTGGETAFALCIALGVSTLQFRAELEAGLSLSDGVARGRRLRLAVKPGGFGDPRTWLRAHEGLERL